MAYPLPLSRRLHTGGLHPVIFLTVWAGALAFSWVVALAVAVAIRQMC